MDKVNKIIDKYKGKKSALIGILQDIQTEYNYLPKEALIHLSKSLDVSLIRIYGIATFYKSFSLKPRGKHLISVCLGTACHVRGAVRVLEKVERSLNIKPGQTTKNLMFTLETVNCLGACALGPLMVVDGKYFGKMASAKVDKILKAYKDNEENLRGKRGQATF